MSRAALSAVSLRGTTMDFKFANLMGAPYRGGNIVLAGTELLSPVGNRVSQVQRDTAPCLSAAYERHKQIYEIQGCPLQVMCTCRSI